MYCGNCGAKSEGGRFCGSCGSPLPTPATPATGQPAVPQALTDPVAVGFVHPDAEFVGAGASPTAAQGYVGYPAGQPTGPFPAAGVPSGPIPAAGYPPPAPPGQAPPPGQAGQRKNRMWWIVGVSVVLVAALGVGAFFLLRPSDDATGTDTVAAASYQSAPVPGAKIRAADVMDNSSGDPTIGSVYQIADDRVVLSAGDEDSSGRTTAVIAAMDPTSGQRLWAVDVGDLSPGDVSIPGYSTCRVGEETVLTCVVVDDSARSAMISRIALDTGTVSGSVTADASQVVGWVGGEPFVALWSTTDPTADVSRLDPATGKPRWTITTEMSGGDSAPAFVSGQDLIVRRSKEVAGDFEYSTDVVDPPTGQVRLSFDRDPCSERVTSGSARRIPRPHRHHRLRRDRRGALAPNGVTPLPVRGRSGIRLRYRLRTVWSPWTPPTGRREVVLSGRELPGRLRRRHGFM